MGVVSTGESAAAAADSLREYGIAVHSLPTLPVALTMAVTRPDGDAGQDPADVVLSVRDHDEAVEAASAL